ncbi:hypothetical protein I8752_25410 [Nostocaceae cyanobacterium CENA369]|uniref:Uncharacterized protein n=1 Tax=Dendronalium phyllosphericum CENA369 TaxID=1725256 RepID=A0A8J7I5N5_9NOST|nr:hypothetical protein [Dendronalium phyllosphericum]MBH8576269.1 hypothetical protein [Dendronalium phyllosphericum CENA369]
MSERIKKDDCLVDLSTEQQQLVTGGFFGYGYGGYGRFGGYGPFGGYGGYGRGFGYGYPFF